ncbi:MAG: hypothetical protein WDO16_16590 [Bacteroidota bacterium]
MNEQLQQLNNEAAQKREVLDEKRRELDSLRSEYQQYNAASLMPRKK